jgi:hypothetical protein
MRLGCSYPNGFGPPYLPANQFIEPEGRGARAGKRGSMHSSTPQTALKKFYTLFYTRALFLVGIGRFGPESRSSLQGDFPSGAASDVIGR